MMTRDQESWAMVLWVEKHQGEHGAAFIAAQIGRLVLDGEEGGIALWRKVEERYAHLTADG
jgi:hypothetical protein